MKLVVSLCLILIVSNLVCETVNEDFTDKFLEISFRDKSGDNNLRIALNDTYDLIKEYPNEVGAYFLAAEILQDLKQFNDGIDIITQAMSLNLADNLYLYSRRMIFYELLGKDNLATEDWEFIKTLQSKMYGDTLTFIKLYLNRKELDNALTLINELLKAKENSYTYIDGLHFRTKLNFEHEQYIKSITDIDSIIRISDEMGDIPFELFFLYKSIIFYRLNRLEESKYNFRIAINIFLLMQEILKSNIHDASRIEYLHPYEGAISDFDLSNFEGLGDITEFDNLISNENMDILQTIYSLLVDEEIK